MATKIICDSSCIHADDKGICTAQNVTITDSCCDDFEEVEDDE